MAKHVTVGIIGDYNPSSPTHLATHEALRHTEVALSMVADASWIPTPELEEARIERRLESFDGIWAAPGSPYRSLSGALNGIRFARERQWPFFGTRLGFQHALVEYARNVLGIRGADHEKASPNASTLVISRLACSLAGQTETIQIAPDSVAHQAYGKQETIEDYRCNFGLNPKYRNQISKGPLVVTGVGTKDAVRIVELSGHPFFVATLFLPQLSSKPDAPHPLIMAYLKAVTDFHGRKATT